MRIRISGICDGRSGALAVDEWVPFWFKAQPWNAEPPDYWFFGNARTVLELAVEQRTRAIIGVVMPCYGKPMRKGLAADFERAQDVPGTPTIDAHAFERGQYREHRDFTLSHSGNRFVVAIDDAPVPQRCLRVDRVGFFESSGELCGVGFFDITDSEVDTVLSWHMRQGGTGPEG